MKPGPYSDEELIKQFNEGDSLAFAQVYDTWFPHLRFFASRVTKDIGEAEDITVTALQELLVRHRKFETLENVKAFLYITVRNKCLKFIEKSEKQKATHKEHQLIRGDAEEFVLSQMVKAELMKEIIAEIESLPAKRKEVFRLFYIEGLDISEIAEKLNMKEGAVRTNKSKALTELRTLVFNKKLLPVSMALILFLKVYACCFSLPGQYE